LVELWFDSIADCEAFQASVASPELIALITADEERFLDRLNCFRYSVEDHLSFGPQESE
jgi:hypothetical protein